MNRTTAEFETQLTEMGVEIDSIKLHDNFVHKVFGKLNNKLYSWDAAGSCFAGQIRVPELDIPFITFLPAEDKITIGKQTHILVPRRFWHPRYVCKICSIARICGKDIEDYCLKSCTVPFDGYYKLQKP